MTFTTPPLAIVFDMDGTLLDSERIAYATFVSSCAHFGLSAQPELYRRCIGTRGEQTRAVLRAAFGPELALDAFWEHWSDLYRIHAIEQVVPLKAGAIALLTMLNARAIPCAVATSTRRATALRKLANADLLQFFDFVLGGDEVSESKPHPRIYQEATRRFAIAPHRAWAIEDSDAGVRSAVAAGLHVIQIPDMHPPEEAVAALGHRVVASLDDVRALLPR